MRHIKLGLRLDVKARAVAGTASLTVRHEFPDGYAAHWVRLTADTDCAATAAFTYE